MAFQSRSAFFVVVLHLQSDDKSGCECFSFMGPSEEYFELIIDN